MDKFFPRLALRQDSWMDTKAGRFLSPHVCLGAVLIFLLLWDNVSNLWRNDFTGFIVWTGLTVLAAVTVLGALVIYFVAQTDFRDSNEYARYGFWLAIAYLCFSIGVVGISWTFLIGYAIVSLVYLAESVILLVMAWRILRELRATENWTSMR